MTKKIKSIPEKDLERQASDFGEAFLNHGYDGAPMEDRAIAYNAAAKGFIAGVRFYEKYFNQLQIQREEETPK